MVTKIDAQKEARELRKMYSHLTINVKEITPDNFGVRFSPKGKRDKFKVERW